MSVDTWTQRRHAEAFEDDPPCAECRHPAEEHDLDDKTCATCERFYGDESEGCCEGYRPDDPADHAPDGWEDE